MYIKNKMDKILIFVLLVLLFIGKMRINEIDGFAPYRQWRFGHNYTPYSLPKFDFGSKQNMLYHHRPYHYAYGERAYGMYRPFSLSFAPHIG